MEIRFNHIHQEALCTSFKKSNSKFVNDRVEKWIANGSVLSFQSSDVHRGIPGCLNG